MSQITSTLSSLLMSLPLIAVPCLAIFGLPTSQSDATSEEEIGIELGVPSGLGESTADSHGDHAHDAPFGPLRNADRDSSTAEHVSANSPDDRAQIAPTSGHHGAAANAAAGLGAEGETAETHGHHDDHHHAGEGHGHSEPPAEISPMDRNPFLEGAIADNTTAEGSTALGSATEDPAWSAAIEKLERLGVTQFRINQSDVPGEFFFCCSVRTSRNILQRFEAEAATRVAAARDVLAQVESWQSTR